MLLLPSRNVGCHLLPLRQLPVPPPAAVVGRVRRSAPSTKFETFSSASETTATINPKNDESYWFLRGHHQACRRRLSTVIAAAVSTGRTITTCSSSNIIQFPSIPCYRCTLVQDHQKPTQWILQNVRKGITSPVPLVLLQQQVYHNHHPQPHRGIPLVN